MLFINANFVFSGDWSGDIVINTNQAMAKAILDAFSDGVTYLSAGEPTEPPENHQEAIEQGITDVTHALNF